MQLFDAGPTEELVLMEDQCLMNGNGDQSVQSEIKVHKSMLGKLLF